MVVSTILARVALKLLDFWSMKVSYVKRQGNIPAHILAKYVNDIDNSDNYVMWIEENPPLIESAITHDVLNLFSSNLSYKFFILKKKKKKLKSIRYHGHLCILNINVLWRATGGVIEYEIAISFFSGCWEPWGKDFLFLDFEICLLLFVEKEKEKYALCRLMIVFKKKNLGLKKKSNLKY